MDFFSLVIKKFKKAFFGAAQNPPPAIKPIPKKQFLFVQEDAIYFLENGKVLRKILSVVFIYLLIGRCLSPLLSGV